MALDHSDSSLGEAFQFSRGEISFAQLNVVDAASRSLCDLPKQSAAPGVFIAGKLLAISDVVEKQVSTQDR